MRTNNMKLEALEIFTVRLAYRFASAVLVLFLLSLLLVVGLAKSSFAQEAQPKTFASAGDAANALFEATQKQDEKALEAILGAGKEVTSSSDEVEDKLDREQFSKKYQEMHRLVQEADGHQQAQQQQKEYGGCESACKSHNKCFESFNLHIVRAHELFLRIISLVCRN